MSFEGLRAQFSHGLLENLLFSYLCGPVAVWRVTPGSDMERAKAAAEQYQTAANSHPEGLRRVSSIWKDYQGKGVAELTRELYQHAIVRTPYVPTQRFPSWEEVASWLDEMNNFVQAVETDGHRYVAGRETSAYSFWVAALKLYRFVQALRYGSPDFWAWYEERL